MGSGLGDLVGPESGMVYTVHDRFKTPRLGGLLTDTRIRGPGGPCVGRGLGERGHSQVGVLVGLQGAEVPSPAAALGCGDGTEAAFPHAQVPVGSQVLASPASASTPATLGPLQKPHLPPWDPGHLKQRGYGLGFTTSPPSATPPPHL